MRRALDRSAVYAAAAAHFIARLEVARRETEFYRRALEASPEGPSASERSRLLAQNKADIRDVESLLRRILGWLAASPAERGV